MKKLYLLTIFVLVSLVVATAAHAQVSVMEFPAPDPTMNCGTEDINELGDVLVNCTSRSPPFSRAAYIWSIKIGVVTTVPISISRCFSINDNVQLLCADGGTVGSFLWSTADGAQPIIGVPIGLNDLGEIAVANALAECDAITISCLHIQRADGTLVPVPTEFGLGVKLPAGGGNVGFNNNSQLLVRRRSDGARGTWSPTQGFLALPPNSTEINANSLGTGLNDAGQIGGTGRCSPSCPQRGWRVTPGVGWELLSHPAGYESASSWADGVDVVGGVAASIYGTNASGESFDRAFYWPTPDSPIDLGDYFGMRTWAWRSNAAGLVAGGTYLDGSIPDKAVVWNIAPPPPPPPTQQIDNIEENINSLVTSGLIDAGDASGLQAKLQGATQALEQNAGTPAAANILKAASKQVNALLKSKRISQTDADALQALLNTAITSL